MTASSPPAHRHGYKPLIIAALLTVAVLVGLRTMVALLRQEQPIARLRHDWASLVGSSKVEQKLKLVAVAQGLSQPTDIQFVPGSPTAAVVLEKKGVARVWRRDAGAEIATPTSQLLRIAVRSESEMGLLGLAFHPDFAKTGIYYLHYNPEQGERRTRIAEWQCDPKTMTQARELRVLLEVPQPYGNHKGGQLAIGPDRMLYIGLGDGGSRADPQGNAQNPKSLLGKMLRVDPKPSEGAPYSVPPDNPFVQSSKFRPEIWAYGLRNPWRFSFTPQRDLITGDVGQDLHEEIDLVRAGDNLGWKVREAGHCFSPPTGCDGSGFVDPIFEYGRHLGISVTGGYVYRGDALAPLRGKYVFGDFGTGRLWALPLPQERGGAYQTAEDLGQYDAQFSSFGQDHDGELYAADFYRGVIYQLQPR